MIEGVSEYKDSDSVGPKTLEALSVASRYSAWQVAQVADFLGRRILEVGAGIGNITAHLAATEPQVLYATDPDKGYLSRLQVAYRDQPAVSVEHLEVPGMAVDDWTLRCIDTIVAFNVVEHIREDREALQELAATLVPGGRVILIIPAHSLLYSELDEALGHYRRYSVRSATRLLTDVGLQPLRVHYFNMAGALGWLWRGRIRRRSALSPSSLVLFDKLVPILRLEDKVIAPFGLSVIAIGQR